MVRIAHVSDVHAAGRWFDEAAFHLGVERVNALKPAHVVFTGDLTDTGIPAEMAGAARLLDAFEAPLSCVMGDQDARGEGWRAYADRVTGGVRYYDLDWGEARFIGLDPAGPDIHEGHIGREQMAWSEERLAAVPPALPVVVALHHHVVPAPMTGRERNILLDSGDPLHALDAHAVPVVLTGHKHQPWCWVLDGMVVATTGTFSSRKTNVGQDFNVIEIADGRVRVMNVDIASGVGRALADVALRGRSSAGPDIVLPAAVAPSKRSPIAMIRPEVSP